MITFVLTTLWFTQRGREAIQQYFMFDELAFEMYPALINNKYVFFV